MKLNFKLLLLAIILSTTTAFAQLPIKWVYPLNGLSNTDVNALEVDKEGNTYAAGSYYGHLNFPDSKQFPNQGEHNGFLIKISATGKTIWALNFESKNYVLMDAACILKNGDVVVSGRNYEPFKLPSLKKGKEKEISSSGTFLACYSAEGDLKWVKNFSSLHASFSSLSADTLGNFYATGFYKINFTSKDKTYPNQKNGYNEYLHKYNSTGELVWDRLFKHTDLDYNFTLRPKVKLLQNQEPVVASEFLMSIKFTENDSFSLKNNEDAREIYFAAFDTEGKLKWKKQLGGLSTQWLGDFDINANNHINGAGQFYREFSISDAGVTSKSKDYKLQNGSGMVMFTLDKDGNLLHMEHYRSKRITSGPQPNSIKALPNGDFLCTGNYFDTVEVSKKDGTILKVGSWPSEHSGFAGIWNEAGEVQDFWKPIDSHLGWAMGWRIGVSDKNLAMSFEVWNDVLIDVNGKEKKIKQISGGRNPIIVGMTLPEKKPQQTEPLLAEACSIELIQAPLISKKFRTKEEVTSFVMLNEPQEEIIEEIQTEKPDTVDKSKNVRGNFVTEISFKVAPNPTLGEIKLMMTGINGNVSLKLFSQTGCLLFSQSVRIESNSYEQQLDLSSLAACTYLLIAEGAGMRKVFKIVKI
jgi:hypothetical protein